MSKYTQIQNLIVQKYCANGNDFLIFHTFMEGDFGELARRLCHRFRGVGADGLVVVLPKESTKESTQITAQKSTKDGTKESSAKNDTKGAQIAYKWDFYNSDGSRASMCGNASRCVGHYAHAFGLAKERHSFLSGAGVIGVEVNGDIVQSNLGKFHSLKKLGKLKEILSLREITRYMEEAKSSTSKSFLQEIKNSKDSSFDLALRWAIGGLGGEVKMQGEEGKDFGRDFVEDSKGLASSSLSSLEAFKNSEWFYLNTGVPHIVCFMPRENLLPIQKSDAQSESTPKNTADFMPFLAILREKFDANVTMAHKIDDKKVAFATYERGVEDITQSCGSGAAAALVVGYRFFGVDNIANLIPPSGEPTQVSEDSNGCVYLRGVVSHIASCLIPANLLATIQQK